MVEGSKGHDFKILGNTRRMIMKFLGDFRYYREANSLFSGNATSGHACFTKFYKIINIDVTKQP